LAFFLLRDADPQAKGAADPKAAASAFMDAFYRDKDVDKAAKAVCTDARDREAIQRQIDTIKKLSDTYNQPTFAWETPTVSGQTADRATVTISLTMTTADEKVSKQELALTAINDQGWWVCEVQSK
jgi:hypothetical protein